MTRAPFAKVEHGRSGPTNWRSQSGWAYGGDSTTSSVRRNRPWHRRAPPISPQVWRTTGGSFFSMVVANELRKEDSEADQHVLMRELIITRNLRVTRATTPRCEVSCSYSKAP
jgi:hypothetical protein